MTPINKEKINFIVSVAREYREGSMAMVSEELSESHNSDTYTEHSLATIVEETKSVEALKDAVQWLGFNWGENVYYTSDYFPKLYEYAIKLIKMGKAYVDSLNEEEIKRVYKSNRILPCQIILRLPQHHHATLRSTKSSLGFPDVRAPHIQ